MSDAMKFALVAGALALIGMLLGWAASEQSYASRSRAQADEMLLTERYELIERVSHSLSLAPQLGQLAAGGVTQDLAEANAEFYSTLQMARLFFGANTARQAEQILSQNSPLWDLQDQRGTNILGAMASELYVGLSYRR